jgi:hypothetical protein
MRVIAALGVGGSGYYIAQCVNFTDEKKLWATNREFIDKVLSKFLRLGAGDL